MSDVLPAKSTIDLASRADLAAPRCHRVFDIEHTLTSKTQMRHICLMSDARSAVLDGAARLLSVNPGASMGDIAAAAGVSRATLHRLFPGRAALVEDLAVVALDSTLAAVYAARADEGPAAEALARLIDALFPVAHLYSFLISEDHLAGVDRLRTTDRRLQEELAGVMRRAQVAGTLRSELSPRWLCHVLGALLVIAGQEVHEGYLAAREAPGLVLTSFLSGAGGGRS